MLGRVCDAEKGRPGYGVVRVACLCARACRVLAAGERAGSGGLVAWPAGVLWSGVVDFEVAADGGGDGLEVAGVGADDQVAAA